MGNTRTPDPVQVFLNAPNTASDWVTLKRKNSSALSISRVPRGCFLLHRCEYIFEIENRRSWPPHGRSWKCIFMIFCFFFIYLLFFFSMFIVFSQQHENDRYVLYIF